MYQWNDQSDKCMTGKMQHSSSASFLLQDFRGEWRWLSCKCNVKLQISMNEWTALKSKRKPPNAEGIYLEKGKALRKKTTKNTTPKIKIFCKLLVCIRYFVMYFLKSSFVNGWRCSINIDIFRYFWLLDVPRAAIRGEKGESFYGGPWRPAIIMFILIYCKWK